MENKDYNTEIDNNSNKSRDIEELPPYEELKNDVKNIKLEYLNEEYDISAFASDSRHAMSCIVKGISNKKQDK